MKPAPSTFLDLLRWRANEHPARPLFKFLPEGEAEEATQTYGELDRRARAFGALLQSCGSVGDRVLLLYPPGLEYISAFFGCLYSGLVAVPAYPPRSARNMQRLRSIVADAQPAIALTNRSVFDLILKSEGAGLDWQGLRWLSTSDLDDELADEWREPRVNRETLAFLQYTSGSTATPKGVMLSHHNLLYNSALISEAFRTDSESIGVSWLPPYHDMGLIGQILNPVYVGAQTVLMAPVAMLLRPSRWLRAISRYRATHSGGPNFAYQMCVRKFAPDTWGELELSCWKVAFNGAEPIRPETLDAFTQTFMPYGFRREAFYPCYGLAEATLMVSCISGRPLPITTAVHAAALEQNQVIETSATEGCVLVGSGRTLPPQQILIVNPHTLTRCEPDEVGEIWVRGQSIAQGYWNHPEETQNIFQAKLADTEEGPFLRTGDLGFLADGELFVTGRLKDLIIICGRNLYPQDIESGVERCHESLRPGCGAAFSVSVSGEEQLVIVQELEFRQKPDLTEVTKAVRRAVTEDHGVQPWEIVLIKPGTITKTSSGKIQRYQCKLRYLAGQLDLYRAQADSESLVMS